MGGARGGLSRTSAECLLAPVRSGTSEDGGGAGGVGVVSLQTIHHLWTACI